MSNQELKDKLYKIVFGSETEAGKKFDVVLIIAIILSILIVMCDSLFRNHFWVMRSFVVLEYLLTIFFTIEYLVRLYCSPKPRAYALSFFGIIDLLSILPTINVLAPTFKAARFSRLLKILRVVKIIRYFESLEIILSVIKKQKKILYAVLSMAMFYTFITAMIMFNAEEDIKPGTNEYLFENFFDAFYWAVCTLTTVGYGDLYPISTTGRVISIISSLVGIAIIALPSGVITAGYLDEIRERKAQKLNEESKKQ